MTRHTIEVCIPVSFYPTGSEDREVADTVVAVTFDFTPGYPETGPTYDCGGEPAVGPEIDLVSAELLDGGGISFDPEQAWEYAEAWLYSDGGDAAIDAAGGGY